MLNGDGPRAVAVEGNGLTSASAVLLRPRVRLDGAVLVAPGAMQSGLTLRTISPDIDVLTDAGTVYCGDLGGTQTWGNATSVTASVAALDVLDTETTGTPLAVGFSMGATSVLNTAWRNTTRIGRMALVVPVLDLQDIHDNNRGGWAASLEAAYTNLAGLQAAYASRSPVLRVADTIALGVDLGIWYSTNDPVCLPAITEDWAGDVGAELFSMGAVGHSLDGLDYDAIVAWLAA